MPSTSALSDVRVQVLEDLADPRLDVERRDALVARGTDVIFLTHAWQRVWWRAFGSGRPVIVRAERDGETAAIAPLYATEEMLFVIGTGGSDYLDVIGRPDEPTLTAMLDAARATVTGFAGFGFYHLPLVSPTTSLLSGVASRLGLELHRGDGMTAPHLDLNDRPAVDALVERASVRKQRTRMQRAGALRMRTAESEQLDEWIELFLSQHASRWRPVGQESFGGEGARDFCRGIVHAGHSEGWLRFTMLEWRDAPAAFDISLVRGGRFLSYVVARDPGIHEFSPGKILSAQMVATALACDARCYDFGLGEEDYKLRFATGATEVANWFLYPP